MKLILPFGEIFLRIAKTGLARKDRSTGSMPAGHNGPYFDKETPLRNTAHWTQIFLCAYRLSGKEEFRDAARHCADYIVGPNAPRNGHIFRHREKEGKDSCNGLIGPAWTIEGLCAAYQAFKDERYLAVARGYFFAHPFIGKTGLWKRVEPDGCILPEDMTFNHQLWFCMAGAMLFSNGVLEAKLSVESFLARLDKHLTVARSGRIEHPIWTPKTWIKSKIKCLLKPQLRQAGILKEVGYHAFNLYAFAVLFTLLPSHPFFKSKRWMKVFRYQRHDEFLSYIDKSEYGFPYNPPGFELPYVNSVFENYSRETAFDIEWLQRQIDWVLDSKTWQLSKNNKDTVTMNARLYECARFSDKLMLIPVTFATKSDVYVGYNLLCEIRKSKFNLGDDLIDKPRFTP